MPCCAEDRELGKKWRLWILYLVVSPNPLRVSCSDFVLALLTGTMGKGKRKFARRRHDKTVDWEANGGKGKDARDEQVALP